MKTLELTWYPPLKPKGDLPKDKLKHEFAKGAELKQAEAKYFTDAELAAEYWCEYAEALHWAPERGRLRTDQDKLHQDSKRQTKILERFATHPHAAEGGYE